MFRAFYHFFSYFFPLCLCTCIDPLYQSPHSTYKLQKLKTGHCKTLYIAISPTYQKSLFVGRNTQKCPLYENFENGKKTKTYNPKGHIFKTLASCAKINIGEKNYIKPKQILKKALKGPKINISKNEKNRFYLMSQGVLCQKIKFLGKKL